MAWSAELERELGDRQVKEGNRVPGDDDGAAIGTKVTWRDMLEEVAFSLTRGSRKLLMEKHFSGAVVTLHLKEPYVLCYAKAKIWFTGYNKRINLHDNDWLAFLYHYSETLVDAGMWARSSFKRTYWQKWNIILIIIIIIIHVFVTSLSYLHRGVGPLPCNLPCCTAMSLQMDKHGHWRPVSMLPLCFDAEQNSGLTTPHCVISDRKPC